MGKQRVLHKMISPSKSYVLSVAVKLQETATKIVTPCKTKRHVI
ncbi:MAG: hypothetical protein NWF00_05435 [Candidatus Bathyarchaeota archaeon]|nr:hypothetical protein [Candidatus Bathyarchaeota archaeon]